MKTWGLHVADPARDALAAQPWRAEGELDDRDRGHRRRKSDQVLAFLLFLLLTIAVPAAAGDDDVIGSVGIAVGVKDLESGWEPMGDQIAFTISLTVGREGWPVHLALDYVSADDQETRTTGFPLLPPFCCFTTDVTAESETTEWGLGVRRFWRSDKSFRPYTGAGVAFIDGKLRVDSQAIRASDSTTGYWVNVGFRRQLGGPSEWGLDLRHSEGAIELGNAEVEAGGTALSFFVGGRW